jgi:hypothetical protein
MFNLKELKVVTSHTTTSDDRLYSFVGIRRSNTDSSLEFCLPKGFDKFPMEDFTLIKRTFFKTYKTYRKLHESKRNLSEEGQYDGFEETENGYQLVGKDTDIITYSKLTVFDSILDAYSEMLILTVKNKLSKSSNIDYSKLHKYLDKAIYPEPEEGLLYIDEVEMEKKIIDSDSPALVQMFCYIYSEIKASLEEEIESIRVKSLTREFRENYLTNESALFDTESFEETITVLKEILDDIDRFTSYKDVDFWHFYEAVYTFLYGENDFTEDEDGNIWGINNFSIVWEELCYAAAKEKNYATFLFADRVGSPPEINSVFQNPFYLQINRESDWKRRRKLRPDLVYMDFDGTVTTLHLKRVFSWVESKNNSGEVIFLRIQPRQEDYDYKEIYDIYEKYANKNPSYIWNPEDEALKCISRQHLADFYRELIIYLSNLNLSVLLHKKPRIIDFQLIDYKYIEEETCKGYSLNAERRLDIKKQLVYELALQLNFTGCQTKSQFWIPYFYYSEEQDLQTVTNLNRSFVDNGITVVKRNYFKLQEIYLQQDDEF